MMMNPAAHQMGHFQPFSEIQQISPGSPGEQMAFRGTPDSTMLPMEYRNSGKVIINQSMVDGTRICAGCGNKILERFLLHALDRFWHHCCLTCSCCSARLFELATSCFTRGGMILCKNDYLRLFGVSGACSACGQNIPPSEFVMRAATLSPDQHQHHLDYVYHVKCFSCTKCQNRLVPGDRYALIGGSLVCEQDCQKLLKNNSLPTSVRRGKVGRPRRAKE
ncbi:LIM domain transcription factor LMO4.2-like [Artemia franciscana]|uniref:LIM zinc-binding domain-containing protein n=1 Tax=Artemia franciscana TaxID=6661 RepID=A0AA88HYX2_ARTSF|nr:hypothetical protein QYM36_009163 [Artemia franciscana]